MAISEAAKNLLPFNGYPRPLDALRTVREATSP